MEYALATMYEKIVSVIADPLLLKYLYIFFIYQQWRPNYSKLSHSMQNP